MKKSLCVLLISTLIFCTTASPAYAQTEREINISLASAESAYQENIYGIDLTDIDCAIDTGLNANLLHNGSFAEKDNAWGFEGTNCVLGSSDSVNEYNGTYCIIKANDTCIVKNYGFGEIQFKKDCKYTFSCYMKNIDYDGEISLQLSSGKNDNTIVKLSTDTLSKKEWTKISTTITASATEKGALKLTFQGNGSLQFDNAQLVEKNSYGDGTEQWKNASLKADTVQALKWLKPAFVLFNTDGAQWQSTIGNQAQRADEAEIGYHEYLALCEDLDAEPIPTLNLSEIKDEDNFDNYIQGVLDMIEYANASPTASYFGALRAGNGSEDEFGIKHIFLKGSGTHARDIISAISDRYSDIGILTEENVQSICSATEYGKGISKSNMGTALMSAREMVGNTVGFTAYKNAIGMANDSLDKAYMLLVDGNGVTMTPEYYTQLLLSNNFAEQEVSSSLPEDNIYSRARLDSTKKILYVSLVNQGSSRTMKINVTDAESIGAVSVQEISANFKSNHNLPGKQRIAPNERELEINGNSVSLEVKSNSVTVVRIAYGENAMSKFFMLPEELDVSTRAYCPTGLKIITAVFCVSIPIGGAMGYFLYRKLSKKKKNVEEEEYV